LSGSGSSSKLVRDDAYPPLPFIRSMNVDDADDADVDRELALDPDCTSARRERGSGGTSGTSEYEAGPPRPPRAFIKEGRVRMEGALWMGGAPP
jgi:hypothetical protein